MSKCEALVCPGVSQDIAGEPALKELEEAQGAGKRKADDNGGEESPAKKQKSEVANTIRLPTFSFEVALNSQGKLTVKNLSAANRKVPKETKLYSAPGPAVVKLSRDTPGAAFSVSPTTLVWDGGSQSLTTLKKMIAANPTTNSIMGRKAWPHGLPPTKFEVTKEILPPLTPRLKWGISRLF